ncbi:MAG: glycosyl hydrolase family 18 protein [Lachnospiraceae bacterium]|nr:glycosyl hydrolase family 18 protein [Lachnospiraceae bacterium]
MNVKKKFQILAGVIALIGMLAILFVCIRKYMPSSQRMGSEEYFGQLGETEAAVVVEDHIAQEHAQVYDGNVYIDYTLVQNELNSRFYWDASVGLLLFTTPTQVFEIAPNTSAYTIDGESFDAGYDILHTTSAGMYLSMTFLQQYSDLNCQVYETPKRVVITYGSEEVTTARIKKDTVVRYQGGIKSPIVTDVTEDSEVTVLEQMDSWSKVLTADGYIGYVKNKQLADVTQTTRETVYAGPEYTSIHLDEKVNLVWHQIDYQEMNSQFAEDTADITGVNVISPTWYFLADSEGEITSFADADYVKAAHKKNMQVWALISNFSADVDSTTLLASRAARQKVQNYLIGQAQEIGFDGINIDFEGIAQEAGCDYVQFIRELSILCRKNGIILSVDVPVPMDFSKYYNREELGNVCDYVIMMGYDEHYAGSDIVGSVASMDFEETGIQNMLTEVSKDKLISAIPFYTRLWYTETLADGTTNVTSEAYSMDNIEALLTEKGVTAAYDESTGQQYAEWTDSDGKFCQVWLEDENSIAARAALISKYELSGIAEWVLGREQSWVWDVISQNI